MAAIVAGGLLIAAAATALATPGRALGWFLPGVTYLDAKGMVRQSGSVDCGVAVLEMVYRDLGLPGELLADVRAHVLERDEGLTLLEMRDLAVEHGLAAQGWRFEGTDIEGLAALKLPLVAHVWNHYVVVDGLGPDWVVLRDPSAGRLRVSRAFFGRWWTGHVLSVQGTEAD